jgi:hypothetical protein
VIDVKNSFSVNEPLELLPVNQARMPFRTIIEKMTDLNGNEVVRAPSNRLVVASLPGRIQPGDMLRRKEAND